MSTYLALTFGTLLSSQGTDASFDRPSDRISGRFVLSCSQLIRGFRHRFTGVSSNSLSFAPLGATPELYGQRRSQSKSAPGPGGTGAEEDAGRPEGQWTSVISGPREKGSIEPPA